MGRQQAPAFMLGDWQVEPAEHRLTRGGESVRLEPRAMAALVYLSSRPGEVVSPLELERAVWRGGTISRDAVSGTMSRLRAALGDRGRPPRYITTLPERGYRLIAPVRPSGPPPGTGSAAGRAPRAARASSNALMLTVVGAAILGWVVLSFVTPEPIPPTMTADDSESIPTIVVLPFTSPGDDPAQAQFADGITEDLIDDLSGLAGLHVIASATAFSYRGKDVEHEALRRDLGVDFVLEGDLGRDGGALRIDARLIDTQSGQQPWAERYDRPVAEVFAVQDELANAVVAALAARPSGAERQRLGSGRADNLLAYEHFLEGQRLGRVDSAERNAAAQAAYRAAIQADPAFGRAYGALARALADSAWRGWNDDPLQALDRALELAQRAVELDAGIPQTYGALGHVYLMRKEFARAEAALQPALEIAPSYADGLRLQALIKNALGEPQAAIELTRRALELNPRYTWDYPYNLGRAHYALDQTESAIVALEAARVGNPDVVPVRLLLAASYVSAGRLGDAAREVEEILAVDPGLTLADVARVLHSDDERLLNRLFEDLRLAGLSE